MPYLQGAVCLDGSPPALYFRNGEIMIAIPIALWQSYRNQFTQQVDNPYFRWRLVLQWRWLCEEEQNNIWIFKQLATYSNTFWSPIRWLYCQSRLLWLVNGIRWILWWCFICWQRVRVNNEIVIVYWASKIMFLCLSVRYSKFLVP